MSVVVSRVNRKLKAANEKETIMNFRKNAANRRSVRLALGVLAVVLLRFVSSGQTIAQVITNQPSPDVINGYSFSIPVAKAVPNPCTGGFVLASGTANVSITTTQTSTGAFTIGFNFSSSGKGEDALADGSLITNGTQQPKYNYNSVVKAEAGFPAMPSYFMLTVPIKDYLQRELVTDPKADALTLKTGLELTFNNGVPSVPIVRSLNVSCK
jgi:hypothetical protein